MKIPEKVKIGAITYDITIVDRPIVVERRECCGMIDYQHNRIEIRDEMFQSEQNAVATFWHEVIHGFVHSRGIEWGDDDELYTEELAKAMHAFCVDNGLYFGKKDAEVDV